MSNDKLTNYHKLSHVTFDCRYHVVWITKYRFKVINEDIKLKLKWSIKHVCDWKGIEIISGSVGENHICQILKHTCYFWLIINKDNRKNNFVILNDTLKKPNKNDLKFDQYFFSVILETKESSFVKLFLNAKL